MTRGLRKALPADEEGQALEFCEKVKANIGGRVIHPFHLLKNRVGHRKICDRGLTNNEAKLCSRIGLVNLGLVR